MEFIFFIQEVMKEAFRVKSVTNSIKEKIHQIARERADENLKNKVFMDKGSQYEFFDCTEVRDYIYFDQFITDIQNVEIYVYTYFFIKTDKLTPSQLRKRRELINDRRDGKYIDDNELFRKVKFEIPLGQLVSGDFDFSLIGKKSIKRG